MSQMTKKVLINGMGTVGSRIARLSLSLGIDVIGVKRSANRNDIKTKELIKLFEDFEDEPAKLELYITEGDDYHLRKREFENLGMEVLGSIEDVPFDEVGYIVDASPKHMEIQNYEKIYSKHPEINFMIQGGGEENITKADFGDVPHLYLSAPNATGELQFEDLSDNNIKQVSCNTTYGATALGLVLNAESPENIDNVYAAFIRRQRDPGTKLKERLRKGPETKFETHHGSDIGKVIPQLKEKIYPTVALKSPWEHFHETIMTIDFYEGYDFDKILKEFKEYPRSVVLEGNFDMEDVLEKVNGLQVPDGDSLFPLYHLRDLDGKKLEIVGLTPQRSIVSPSATDMIVKKILRPNATWEEAFKYTNYNAKWHGYKFHTLKKNLEYKLIPEI